MNDNSDLSVFDRPIEEDGIKYYVFPAGYPLFKANRKGTPTTFRHGIPSFFGIKNSDLGYISAFEKEYGIVFEFATTREYKLIALDDQATQKYLYDNAPPDIKEILEDNYGYDTGIRDSVGEKDKQLAMYLCQLGLEGYATNKMKTDFGGEFHIELLICNAKDGIQFSRQITDDKTAEYIIKEAISKKHAQDLKDARRSAKRRPDDSTISEVSGSPLKKMSYGISSFDSPPRVTAPMELSNYDSPQATSNRTPPPRMALSHFDSPTPPPSTPPPSTPPISNGIFSFFSSPSTPKGGKKREKKTYKKNAKGKRKTNRRRIKK